MGMGKEWKKKVQKGKDGAEEMGKRDELAQAFTEGLYAGTGLEARAAKKGQTIDEWMSQLEDGKRKGAGAAGVLKEVKNLGTDIETGLYRWGKRAMERERANGESRRIAEDAGLDWDAMIDGQKKRYQEGIAENEKEKAKREAAYRKKYLPEEEKADNYAKHMRKKVTTPKKKAWDSEESGMSAEEIAKVRSAAEEWRRMSEK